jgi:hypothetical protein
LVVGAGAAILALAALSLIITPGRRTYVLANLGLLFGILFASASRRFPLGTGRVDLFLLPLVAILLGAGVAFVGEVKRFALRTLWAAAVAGFVVLKFPAPRTPTYPVQVSSPLVTFLAQEKNGDDALLVNVHGTFALGYYSPWPPSFVADASLGTGFYVVPQTARVYVIGEQPDDARNAVARAISAHPARIFLLTVHAPGSLRQEVEGYLAHAGWTLTRQKQRPGAELFVFGPDGPR